MPLALVAAAWLAHAPVWGAQWFIVGSPGPSHTLVEVDLETLRPRGLSGEAVIRISYEATQQHAAGAKYRSLVGTAQFDCQRRTIRLVSAGYFLLPRGGGERVETDSPGHEADLPHGVVRSIPEATQRALLRAICAITQP